MLSGLWGLAITLQAWVLIGPVRAKRWLVCWGLLTAGVAFTLNGADLGWQRLDRQLFGAGCFAAGPVGPRQVPSLLR